MATKKPKNETFNPHQPNIAGATRDVLLASINKGQFPLAVAGLIVVMLIYKMPPENAAEIAKEVLKLIENFHILGWILSVVFAALWFWDSKRYRSSHTNEMNRISGEKKVLQKQSLKLPLTSSNIKA